MYIGIDIGTSKAAAVVMDDHSTVRASASRPYPATTAVSSGRHEQDSEFLLEEAWSVVRQLPPKHRRQIRGIGITGQMHGVVCCDAKLKPTGPLITWQDRRSLEEGYFLPDLVTAAGRTLEAGYGMVTLAWLIGKRRLPYGTVQAGTIADLAVARLCGNQRLLTDPTNAASLGLFDLTNFKWDSPSLERAGIPQDLLPELRPSGEIVGRLRSDQAAELGVPAAIPVAIAVGDNQASMLATLRDLEHEMALTLGSGGQLSAVLQLDSDVRLPEWNDPWEVRPFPGGRLAVVAASMAGGSAWRWLADTAGRILVDLGAEALHEDNLFRKLNELGMAARLDRGLTIAPHFLGERAAPNLKAGILGIDPSNFRLGPIARELAWSIIRNISSRLPLFASANKSSVVGSGNALRRNPILRAAAQDVLQLPLALAGSCEEAAAGAALIAAGRPTGRIKRAYREVRPNPFSGKRKRRGTGPVSPAQITSRP